MNRYALKIYVTLDSILDAVTAESAWRCALNPDEFCLTPDQEPLISVKVKEAFNDLCSTISAYLELHSFNRNAPEQYAVMWLRLRQRPTSRLEPVINAIVVDLLSQYALAAFYGERDTLQSTTSGHRLSNIGGATDVYTLAWRRAKAHLLAILARDANDLPPV